MNARIYQRNRNEHISAGSRQRGFPPICHITVVPMNSSDSDGMNGGGSGVPVSVCTSCSMPRLPTSTRRDIPASVFGHDFVQERIPSGIGDSITSPTPSSPTILSVVDVRVVVDSNKDK